MEKYKNLNLEEEGLALKKFLESREFLTPVEKIKIKDIKKIEDYFNTNIANLLTSYKTDFLVYLYVKFSQDFKIKKTDFEKILYILDEQESYSLITLLQEKGSKVVENFLAFYTGTKHKK